MALQCGVRYVDYPENDFTLEHCGVWYADYLENDFILRHCGVRWPLIYTWWSDDVMITQSFFQVLHQLFHL